MVGLYSLSQLLLAHTSALTTSNSASTYVKHLLIGQGGCPFKHASLRMSPMAFASGAGSWGKEPQTLQGNRRLQEHAQEYAREGMPEMLQRQHGTMTGPLVGFSTHHSSNGSMPARLCCSLPCSIFTEDLRMLPSAAALGFLHCSQSYSMPARDLVCGRGCCWWLFKEAHCFHPAG